VCGASFCPRQSSNSGVSSPSRRQRPSSGHRPRARKTRIPSLPSRPMATAVVGSTWPLSAADQTMIMHPKSTVAHAECTTRETAIIARRIVAGESRPVAGSDIARSRFLITTFSPEGWPGTTSQREFHVDREVSFGELADKGLPTRASRYCAGRGDARSPCLHISTLALRPAQVPDVELPPRSHRSRRARGASSLPNRTSGGSVARSSRCSSYSGWCGRQSHTILCLGTALGDGRGVPTKSTDLAALFSHPGTSQSRAISATLPQSGCARSGQPVVCEASHLPRVVGGRAALHGSVRSG
jgi:hypothetical protein